MMLVPSCNFPHYAACLFMTDTSAAAEVSVHLLENYCLFGTNSSQNSSPRGGERKGRRKQRWGICRLGRFWQKASIISGFSYILSSPLPDHSFLVSLNTSFHSLPTKTLPLMYASLHTCNLWKQSKPTAFFHRSVPVQRSS